MTDPHVQNNSGPAPPDEALPVWRKIDAALSPVIGQRGVAALYQRSLFLTCTDHPSLRPAYESAQRPGDFEALKAALVLPTGPAAEAANRALLQTFIDLLARLVGRALTERLLESVLNPSSRGPAVQDTPP